MTKLSVLCLLWLNTVLMSGFNFLLQKRTQCTTVVNPIFKAKSLIKLQKVTLWL